MDEIKRGTAVFVAAKAEALADIQKEVATEFCYLTSIPRKYGKDQAQAATFVATFDVASDCLALGTHRLSSAEEIAEFTERQIRQRKVIQVRENERMDTMRVRMDMPEDIVELIKAIGADKEDLKKALQQQADLSAKKSDESVGEAPPRRK